MGGEGTNKVVDMAVQAYPGVAMKVSSVLGWVKFVVSCIAFFQF